MARVEVSSREVAAIGPGLLVFVGIVRQDTEATADRIIERLLGYRIFPDRDGKMNLSLQDIRGELLLVPQFTLVADTEKGMRPSFTPAAAPAEGRRLFDYLVERAVARHISVAAGIFGTDMQVTLTNDGPATFWLSVSAVGAGDGPN